MENKIYNEKNGLWYEKQGDYYLSCLELPEQEDVEIGAWGERHRQYLLAHHKVKYYNMLSNFTLRSHLADVEKRAAKMFDNIVNELTEKLKADNMMLWVQKMNNIRNRATEIVNYEVIFV